MPAGHRITTKDQAVAQRYGLDKPRLGSIGHAPVPPFRHGYQPLGAVPAQLNDRIYSSQDGASGDGDSAEGAAIDVVGNDGKLNKVPKHSTWATPATFPTVVKMVNGTKSVTIDSTGITMTDSSTGKSFTIAFASLTQNLALRTDTYCDSGVSKSQMHVGSAPF